MTDDVKVLGDVLVIPVDTLFKTVKIIREARAALKAQDEKAQKLDIDPNLKIQRSVATNARRHRLKIEEELLNDLLEGKWGEYVEKVTDARRIALLEVV